MMWISTLQVVYDAVEDFMTTIAVKSCVISDSGHFQVILLTDFELFLVTPKSFNAGEIFNTNN